MWPTCRRSFHTCHQLFTRGDKSLCSYHTASFMCFHWSHLTSDPWHRTLATGVYGTKLQDWQASSIQTAYISSSHGPGSKGYTVLVMISTILYILSNETLSCSWWELWYFIKINCWCQSIIFVSQLHTTYVLVQTWAATNDWLYSIAE